MDIPSISQIRTSKEEKVNIIKDLLHKWGWSFSKLVFKYLESENGHKGNKKKKIEGGSQTGLEDEKKQSRHQTGGGSQERAGFRSSELRGRDLAEKLLAVT